VTFGILFSEPCTSCKQKDFMMLRCKLPNAALELCPTTSCLSKLALPLYFFVDVLNQCISNLLRRPAAISWDQNLGNGSASQGPQGPWFVCSGIDLHLEIMGGILAGCELCKRKLASSRIWQQNKFISCILPVESVVIRLRNVSVAPGIRESC